MAATLYPSNTKGYNISSASPTVLLPSPGRVPPTTGHWRTKGTHKPNPIARRTDPRPTAGSGLPRTRTTIKSPKKTRTTAPSARALHGAWAKGKLDF